MTQNKRIKVLRNRRKRASKGHLIRISDEMFDYLDRRRQKLRSAMSWDTLMRKLFGLPNRRGEPQPLVEGFLEVNTGRFYLDEADANGASVVAAVRAKNRPKKPLRMREYV